MNCQEREVPINFDSFSSLTKNEQRVLIYFKTAPKKSDISLEELSSPEAGIAESEQDVRTALGLLIAKNLIQPGINPLRQEELQKRGVQSDGQDRFYILPQVYDFIINDLQKRFRELGLIE